MSMPRKVSASAAISALAMVVSAGPAGAQTIVDPQVVAERNDGGWVYWIAIVLGVLGALILVFLTIQYMRYAPRFSKDEESLKLVRADRVRLGRELPRRNVDLSQAAPVVVAPPAVPTAAPALAAVAAPAAGSASPPASAAAEAQTPPAAAASAPAAAEAAAAAPPEADATDPAAAEASAPADAPAPPAAEAPSAAPAPPAATPAPPAAPAERVEVSMDQEAYEATLKELLDAGTDRRIAEGKARRAGMIAARKKATGEA